MTFISFPNICVTSENRQYRIEIVGTPGDDFFRDQSHFAYRLFRLNQCVWEWFPARENSEKYSLADFPHEAWVNDDGWVVVRTHEWFHAGLLVLSPNGQVMLHQFHRSFDDQNDPGFLDGEPEAYLGDSSAGPFWSRSSLQYFFEQDRRPFWVTRTWGGRRVVIDLQQGVSVDPTQLDEKLVRPLEVLVIRKALTENLKQLEVLQNQVGNEEQQSEFWELARPVLTAAYHAGWLQCPDFAPELRRLEVLKAIGGSGYGPVPWAVLHMLPCCQVAKSALLRMNQEPQWQSHYDFEPHVNSDDKSSGKERTLFQFPSVVDDRNIDILMPGMTQQETLLRIGAPDFIQRDAWEYDFVTPQGGSTARILWGNSPNESSRSVAQEVTVDELLPRITKVEILEPQWQKITMRDHYMI